MQCCGSSEGKIFSIVVIILCRFVLGYEYKKIALIELVSYLPKTCMFFIAAKTGMFHTYGILMFGIGNLIYYGMCLLLTFYLTNYKIIFIKSFSAS